MNQAYQRIRHLGAEVLAIQVECSAAGTRATVKRHKISFPMANDEYLRVVDKYGPTSTYLIDAQGIIRARWLDAIHRRVKPQAIVEALSQLRRPDKADRPVRSSPKRRPRRPHPD